MVVISITEDQRQALEQIAADCEAQADEAAALMLEHKRRMQMLRQRAFVLREVLSSAR